MAEINTPNSHRQRKGTRCSRLSTRVDLTPMVDLGFLLITFFIFTTSLSEPTAMNLLLPSSQPTDKPTLAPEKQTLQLVLNGNETITWFNGEDSTQKAFTHYGATGLRRVISAKMQRVAALYGNADKTIVLIKPTAGARFGNIVAVLDEMLINRVKTYVLLDGETGR